MNVFKDVENRDDLFERLGISKQLATYLLYGKGIDNCYSTFVIEKRNGDPRVINAPNKELKSVQKRLVNAILLQRSCNNQNGKSLKIAHAFEKNKSIITNAKVHRNKRFVLNVDLEDFFTSFHFGRVRGFFENDNTFKVPRKVATVIAQLTCYKGVLPQGAPSSPIITNLICRIMDLRILKLSKKFNLNYTRYADDLCFSTNDQKFLLDEQVFLSKLTREICKAGFKINSKKTRLQFRDSRQKVTGLVVNRKLNVPREFYKNTRAMANKLYANSEFTIDGKKGSIDQLEGRFAFINQIDRWNNSLELEQSITSNMLNYQKLLLRSKYQNKEIFGRLNAREREYQKFLYYKYFYGNDKPIVVTEGKTDILYIKAALKNLYQSYPDLVERIGNDYKFKVSFFKKSKNNKEIPRIKYFLNIPQDGADSMKNLYSFFSDKNSCYPNYLDYFQKKYSSKPLNPVIFIFDNEIENNKKPARNFVNHIKIRGALSELRDKQRLRIIGNLYMIVTPLVNSLKETDIESLFSSQTLEHKIDGKSFNRNGGKEYYGKGIFAQYVSKNYENIDFTNFKPLLDNLNKVIIDYKDG